MYNRYVPQPDGSYRRNRMEDPIRVPETPPKECYVPVPEQRPEETKPKQPCRPACPPRPYRPSQRAQEKDPGGIGNFLKQLLPRDFDTADLIVVLLLMLMSTDGNDDNCALLTLALYLFL